MRGIGGRRNRRQAWALGVVGTVCVLASLTYAVVQLIHGGLEPADTAGLIGLPVGVAALFLAVKVTPVEGGIADQASAWAETLAKQVEAAEESVWRQLLGDDTKRINLTYTLHASQGRAAQALPAGRMFTDEVTSVPDIVDYYCATRPGRLVITGAAGAGKSVLVLELILALVEARTVQDPVPVRISLTEWDTDAHNLAEFLTRHLEQTYDWPRDRATTLIEHRKVLPILDGLDEMDATCPDGSPDPQARRAHAALVALNAHQHGRVAGPVVLTCRTEHYAALAGHADLLDAARVSIGAVSAQEAITYLTARARDVARWRPVLATLHQHPDGELALALSTPWRLGLAATAYHVNGDPSELLDQQSVRDLDEHLLARYIPAATTLVPGPPHYQPATVHRWLHHLARHLTTAAPGSSSGSGSDLVPHRLWTTAGAKRIRLLDGVFSTLVLLATLPLGWAGPRPEATQMITMFFAVSSAAIGFFGHARPIRMDWILDRLSADRADIVRGFLAVLAGVWLLLVGSRAQDTPVLGFVVFLATLLVLGGMPGLRAAQEVDGAMTASRPRDILRGDLLHGVVTAGAAALVIGLAAWSSFGGSTALMFAFMVGLFSLVVVPSATRRYAIFVLCTRQRLPWRLITFMDWACTAGLLRHAGPAYQFRHRELQLWLAMNPQPQGLVDAHEMSSNQGSMWSSPAGPAR